MAKTWLSYIMLAVGVMLLGASELPVTADDKESSHVITFGTEKNMEVFVQKLGDNEEELKLIINGKETTFKIPAISNGETKTFTTEDGSEVTIKGMSGNRIILFGDETINLPMLSSGLAPEGLGSVIAGHPLHLLSQDDTVRINVGNLSEDVRNAIREAVEGVLISYDIDRKVVLQDNKFDIQFKTIDGDTVFDLIHEQAGEGKKEMKFEIIHKKDN